MPLVLTSTAIQHTSATAGLKIGDAGYITQQSTRKGMGTSTANNRDLQWLTWTGNKTNSTITLLSTTSISELPVAGIIGLSVTMSGLGTTRLYRFTGPNGGNLSMIQGGNRGAGEDATLNFTGGINNIGFTLTTSGYGTSHTYLVWAMLGVQTAQYAGNDIWLTS
jgi:hypothetical protein